MTETLPYDFSTGNTNPEIYPGEALADAAARVIPRLATALNTYPGKLGHEGLRRLLAARAAERGVGFRPGSEYHVAGKDVPFIRLAFGFPDVATIEAGIARLGECIREAMVPT